MEEYPVVTSPIVSLQIQKWGAPGLVELGSRLGVMGDICNLRSLLIAISAVLEESETGSTAHRAPNRWLRDVKDAAFDADDVVDELQDEAERRKVLEEAENPVTTKVRNFFSSRNFILFRRRMAREIRARVRDFDQLAEEKENFHFTLAARNTPANIAVPQNTSHLTSPIMASGVYGRDREKEMVIDFLLNRDNDRDTSVLPILGMGGTGKTTLAQLVYNDDNIRKHFDVRIWITVADVFDVEDLAKVILRSVTAERYELIKGLEILQKHLQRKLEKKRFLLVLDDVWNEDSAKWEMLEFLLRNDMLGNKVIVTTRSAMVADIMGTVNPFRLSSLSFDASWMLFAERAFSSEREKGESVNPKLVEIGKEIVSRCGGLPSALKAIGAILATKQSEQEWAAILNNIYNSSLFQVSNDLHVLPALGLSYLDLRTHLKQCFTYCVLFPRDYKISRLQLIQAWIAEGFVQWTGEVLPPEDIANDYFNDILNRSLLQDAEIDEYGSIVSCRMHDLIYDLAASAAGDNAISVERETTVPPGCRYISVLLRDNFSPSIRKVANEAKKLRSLLVLAEEHYPTHDVEESDLSAISSLTYLRVLHLSNIGIKDIPRSMGRVRHLRYLNLSKNKITRLPDSILGEFKQLRFLDLSKNKITRLPDSILGEFKPLRYLNLSKNKIARLPDSILGELKQLRFLDLSGNLITSLPESITTLYHLESLNLQDCKQLQELPDGISNISSLRHLDILGCEGLTCMPHGLGKLTNLRTLPLFIVGEEPGRSIVELQNLKQIRGQLRIEDLHILADGTHAMEAKIGEKQDLRRLELCWNRNVEASSLSEENDDKKILENLQPHSNLWYLRIVRYEGDSLPGWLTKMDPFLSVSSLKELSLHSLGRCKNLPLLGHLYSLERLNICRMDAITTIDGELYGDAGTFPSLLSLTLCDLPNLGVWLMPERDMFPRLTNLEISWCPNLVVQNQLPSSIKELVMLSSNEKLLGDGGGLQGLSRLRKLSITGFKASESQWKGLQDLTALEELTISCCPKLTCLPAVLMQQQFPSLHTLILEFNPKLMSLGGDEPRHFITSLRHLTIRDCGALRALPEWLGDLTSLTSLVLKCCNNLAMLPDGLRRLTTLQQLTIDFCHLLEKRCEMGGEDRYKIDHIPSIDINKTYAGYSGNES